MINIAVCIKQVPITDNVKFDWEKGTLKRDIAQNMMNPDDLHALELALVIKERWGAKITAITMGPPQAEAILRQAYALGVDHGVLITDPAFAGSDSLITSKILKKAIKYIDYFHLVFTGFQSIDGNTSHVSYQLAEALGIPHITKIHSFEIMEQVAVIERIYGHELQKVSLPFPFLVAVNSNANSVRYPRLSYVKQCFSRPIQKIGISEIGGRVGDYGAENSPTKTIEGVIAIHKRKREIFAGTTDEKADLLIQKMKKYNIL